MVIGSCDMSGEEEECGTGEGDGKTGGNGPTQMVTMVI